MPGFRYCSWCSGKGCVACPGEEKKWAAKAAASAPKWRDADVRDLRNQALADETRRLEAEIGVTIGTQEEFRRREYEAHAAVEKAFEPALDAEYKRQFPNGPTPIFIARTGNAADMELLKSVAHRSVLEAVFGEGGRGMAEIEERAEAARQKQDPPFDYKPIGDAELPAST